MSILILATPPAGHRTVTTLVILIDPRVRRALSGSSLGFNRLGARGSIRRFTVTGLQMKPTRPHTEKRNSSLSSGRCARPLAVATRRFRYRREEDYTHPFGVECGGRLARERTRGRHRASKDGCSPKGRATRVQSRSTLGGWSTVACLKGKRNKLRTPDTPEDAPLNSGCRSPPAPTLGGYGRPCRCGAASNSRRTGRPERAFASQCCPRCPLPSRELRPWPRLSVGGAAEGAKAPANTSHLAARHAPQPRLAE